MKKNYATLYIASLLSLNIFSQSPLPTYYPVSIPGTTVTTNNVNKRSSFVIDNTGNKWIGINSGVTTSFQLMRYNGTAWDTFPAFNALSPTNKVNALAVDASNNLWIGSNMGLTKYNGTSFITYNTANSGLISDTIISIGCGNGNVYAGSGKGLSVYNGTNFSNYTTANGMNSNVVNCVTVENANTVWLGTPNGLDKFNGSSFTFNYVTANNTADNVNCIYIDAQNNKWIGTNAHGTIKYDNSNFYTFQQIYPISNLQETLGTGTYPVIVKTICTGPNGGALFCSLQAGNLSGRSYEVTANQVYTYISIAASSTVTGNQYLMQHDVGSNKIFIISPSAVGASHVLYSYEPIPVVQAPAGSVNVETTSNTAFLDINNVCALVTDNSNQHWDASSSASKYFAPKERNSSPLFSSAMWIGGFVNGQIRMAAMTYRQNGFDFWPGPLDTTTATIDTATMSAYNHVWKINRFDIANFIYHWNAGDVQNGTWVPVSAILNWPAQGAGNYTRKMAPFVDLNNNGIYDPIHDGDYPLIKGDQMIWSVYNDAAYNHTETGSIGALGIEVHASAYAFTCPNIADSNVVLNNTTFYNYQIFNRSSNVIDSTHIGLWEDTDLGNYQDDYVGCDVTNDFGYTYNGDTYDEDVILPGYHSNLPVFACNILGGPIADAGDGIDNNHNCQIDEPGERCMMDGFTYYNNSGNPLNGNPNAPNFSAYYNLINNHWINGVAMTYGALGLTAGGQTCKYLYPGNTDPIGFGLGATNCSAPVVPPISSGPTGWTEKQAGNTPGDRRMMVNVGKFTMQPGGMYELDYALVFSQDSANCDTSTACLIGRATQDNKRVKHWFNTNTYPSCLDLSTVGLKKNAVPQLDLNLYPNPANTNVYVEFTAAQKNVTIEVFDMLGNLVQGLQYNELGKYAIVPVSTLQSGVYMVKIQSAEGTATKKFIKQ
ncbi:MAG TPA: T9SS type A sorting domain-containing protein [Bacteroidia bacterium]|nr:T9SS type A sorting domain-containing protein [Bacteroidia bacterium]